MPGNPEDLKKTALAPQRIDAEAPEEAVDHAPGGAGNARSLEHGQEDANLVEVNGAGGAGAFFRGAKSILRLKNALIINGFTITRGLYLIWVNNFRQAKESIGKRKKRL